MTTEFRKLLGFAAGIGFLLTGCAGGSYSFRYHEERGRREHICSVDCHHHYYDGERLIILKGHRHSDHCGHYWNGTHWIVRSRTHGGRPVAHICSRSCHHHYHDGRALVVLNGHRHGPHCGHHWNGTYWVVALDAHRPARGPHAHRGVRRAGHVHDAHCGCVFDRRRDRWIVLGRDHVHRRGCGHLHLNGRWCIR